MRSLLAALVALLAVLTPAFADHPVQNVPAGPTEPAAALAEMATDGYVLEVTRASERVFEVRVLHRQEPLFIGPFSVFEGPQGQLALDRVAVVAQDQACATGAACGNIGLWLHSARVNPVTGDVQVPTAGFYPAQTHALRSDLGGTFLEVTIDAPLNPTFTGGVIAVVGITGDDWVRGFYNSAKLAAPLDALDAVPQPIRIS